MTARHLAAADTAPLAFWPLTAVVLTEPTLKLAWILVDHGLAEPVAPSRPEPVKPDADLVDVIPPEPQRLKHLGFRILSHLVPRQRR